MLCADRLSIGSGVDGGFASHMLVPARLLHALPDWLDDHAAALLEPLACVCNALFDPNQIQPGDRVVVSGAGPVGILAAQVVRAAGGVPTLVGTAADAGRLAVAAGLGIDSLSVEDEAARARLDEEGRARRIDVVVECAGAEAAVVSGLRLVRPRGRYVQVGLLSGLVRVPFGEIVLRELAVSGGFGSSPASWFRATRLVERRAVDLLPLVSAVLPLARWPEALDRLVRREGLKTVLDPRLS
jgi:L-iditol 2-dehydrogenase